MLFSKTILFFLGYYWSGRVSNGFVREPMNDFSKGIYEQAFAGAPELADCKKINYLETIIRKADVIVPLECDGEMKFAELTSNR